MSPDACTLPTAERPLRLAEAMLLDIEVPAAYADVLRTVAERANTISTGVTP